jgi:quinoprotein relay system zinc metallohydrolase 2
MRRRDLAGLVFGSATALAFRPTVANASTPFALAEVAPGVFVHEGEVADFAAGNQGDIANAGCIVGDEAVLVVDTGGSARVGEALAAAIGAVTDRPIRWVVNTHVHPDHSFGNAAFLEGRAGAEPIVVGHARLPRAMAERGSHYLERLAELMGHDVLAGTRAVPPTLLVEDERVLDLGNRLVRLRAWPTAHTDQDLTVLDESTGTLFTGDLVFMRRLPVIDGSLLGWLALLDVLEGIAYARVVPGHGPAMAPWPTAGAAQRRYLEALRDDLRKALADKVVLERAISAVASPPPASLSGEAWLLAEENHGRNVMAGYTELEWE